MTIFQTDRLLLRRLCTGDASFILELLNDPGWLRFIGDKGVRTLDGARDYIVSGPMAMYERCGFGLYLTALKVDATPIGLCGLIKRDTLPDVDIGFAFLPPFRGQGYALEAARAVRDYGQHALGLSRIVAITSPDNDDSVRLLQRLGFGFEKMVAVSGGEPDTSLFTLNCAKDAAGR